MQETFRVSTDERLQTVEITGEVAGCVPSDLDAGTCHVFSRHTTAGVLVNEDEPRLRDDLEGFLADLVPDSGHHHDELDGNTVRLAPLD
jgi:secondary thiamine-phosphate synthase enzyme